MASIEGLPETSTIDNPGEAGHVNKEWDGLAGSIQEKFYRSETQKQRFDEQRWVDLYRNFRGVYDPGMQFHRNEKSKVFVKITKTKVLAAYGQILDVLFGNGKFPIEISPTEIPDGVADVVHLQPEGAPTETAVDVVGFPGDGRELAPGETLAGLQDKYGELPFEKGKSPVPEMPELRPANILAKNMQKKILDQLTETHAIREFNKAIFEMCLLGTGVIKGPFTTSKTINKWEETEEGREYTPEYEDVPKLQFVSVWDFYPDPDASNINDSEWVIQRHKLNKSQLRELARRPFFDVEKIRICIEAGPNYEKRGYEDQLPANEGGQDFTHDRFEVLEYWGPLSRSFLEESGLDIDPDDFDDLEEIQINAWVCNGEIIRVVLNPFEPQTIPYHVADYETNPYQFFGVGVAENMEDSQMIMNGHARMAIDNLALAGNLVLDIDENALVPGQDTEIYAGKVFRRQTGQAGQAVYPIKFPNTAGENLEMFRAFRQFADEQTGIPSISHGQTGVSGTGRTAAGMSMLMGASSISMKTVISNIDEQFIKPVGESFYAWNMQFSEDDDLPVRGDVDVKAKGTASMMQKEVKSQRLMMFINASNNPNIAPAINWTSVIKELAEVLELDPDEIINDPETTAINKRLLAMEQGEGGSVPGGGQQAPMGAPSGAPAGAQANDPTGSGDGTIGTGTAPTPGEASFAGSAPVTPGSG